MKVVLDTNVLVSGVFFSGPPYRILSAWRDGVVQLIASPAVVEEYRRVGERLAAKFSGISLDPMLGLVATHALVVPDRVLARPVCDDPDDDKFLACALAGRCRIVVSGDKALLRVSGYRRIEVLTPRQFVDTYLEAR